MTLLTLSIETKAVLVVCVLPLLALLAVFLWELILSDWRSAASRVERD